MSFDLGRNSPNEIVLGGESFSFQCAHQDDSLLCATTGGKGFEILIEKTGATTYVAYIDHYVLEVDLEDQLLIRIASSQGKPTLASTHFTVIAPMPGLVSSVEVKIGEKITVGSRLVVLEAMKMENQIRSAVAGTISEICVKSGETVEKGQTLLLMELNSIHE